MAIGAGDRHCANCIGTHFRSLLRRPRTAAVADSRETRPALSPAARCHVVYDVISVFTAENRPSIQRRSCIAVG